MSAHQQYRTAESVSPKHPDKLCDQISDAVLDAHLEEDPNARVAVDVAGGHGYVFVTGEVTSRAKNVDVEAIVHRIAGDDVRVYRHVVSQSSEIAQGVDTGGAGDQGIMIGYATSETPEMLPLEVVLSRRLNEYLYQKWPYDGKTQVTLRDGEVASVVASFQHAPSDKLIVDNYGPRISIGGGAFSGKDATKVDRSAAYMARKIAVDYLRERGAKEVFVRLAYAIGVAEPLEATVLIDGVHENVTGYDLTPRGIIKQLDLLRPQYEKTARYGHFGHGFTWEK
jgi:S-adenosylmethionine synthetase